MFTMFLKYLLPFFLSLTLFSSKARASPSQPKNIILFNREITTNEYVIFSLSHYTKHHPYPHYKNSANMIQILLILSGSVEVNPGPRRTRVKFPCGECKKAITTNNAIACDECNKWYHVNCLSMNASVFNAYTKDELLEWICPNCALANISNSLFDSFSASSTAESDNDDDENQNNPPKTKRQSLRIMIVNFQSIWGKK
eukprot:TCONS_00030700-protein